MTKAKLAELERLREQIDSDLKKHGDASKITIPDHIDVYQWENFHKEDLRKLITKVSKLYVIILLYLFRPFHIWKKLTNNDANSSKSTN